MAKEKKSLQANLMGRTVIYSILSVGALISSFFLLYFGMIYTVITFSSLNISGFQFFPAVLGFGLLAMGFATILLGFKNGRVLWAQWQRKKAISDEAQRVSRLMDEKADIESVFESDISQAELRES